MPRVVILLCCLQEGELLGDARPGTRLELAVVLELLGPAILVKDEPVQVVGSSVRLESQRRSLDRLVASVQTGHVVELTVETFVLLLLVVLLQQGRSVLVCERQTTQTVAPIFHSNSLLVRPGMLRPG